ncbi:ATP-binding protein [Candidatus Omnitrophota bacterium]
MAKRKIINIDESKCTGCGLCIPNCPEGALQIIDGKARLVSDLFCDGLGACMGHCPEGAISIEEREAGAYDERRVMANIVKQGRNVIKAHLEHLKEHGETALLKQAEDFLKEKNIEVPVTQKPAHAEHKHTPESSGCPGSRVMDFGRREPSKAGATATHEGVSELRQWPVQIKLVPPFAPYFKDADLLVAADCVGFAYADFHQDLLKGKVLLVGCPKLDDAQYYLEKITQILKDNQIKSVTCAHMEVPCCFGLVKILKEAISAAGKSIPFEEVTISIKGERS